MQEINKNNRIVITGIGLTAPNGNSLKDYRSALLEGVSGLSKTEVRYMGEKTAGFCDFDENKYQKKKSRRRGTRAGSISIYCANEALIAAEVNLEDLDRDRVGVYIGITEHGNVETRPTRDSCHDSAIRYRSGGRACRCGCGLCADQEPRH